MAITIPAIMKALAAPSRTGTGPGPINVNRSGTRLRRDTVEHVQRETAHPNASPPRSGRGGRRFEFPLTPTIWRAAAAGRGIVVQW